MRWIWRKPRNGVEPANPERDEARADTVRDLAQQLGRANAVVNQHEATIRALNKAVQDYQRQLAEKAAENVALADRVRAGEASLSGVREQLRQERRERARAEQEAAEKAATIDGLGLAMAEMERAERRQFLDDDHRHVRLADGAEDHL